MFGRELHTPQVEQSSQYCARPACHSVVAKISICCFFLCTVYVTTVAAVAAHHLAQAAARTNSRLADRTLVQTCTLISSNPGTMKHLHDCETHIHRPAFCKYNTAFSFFHPVGSGPGLSQSDASVMPRIGVVPVLERLCWSQGSMKGVARRSTWCLSGQHICAWNTHACTSPSYATVLTHAHYGPSWQAGRGQGTLWHTTLQEQQPVIC